MIGPYKSEDAAARAPLPRAIRDLWDTPGNHGETAVMVGATIRNALVDACAAADVRLADFDRRILDWLCGWPPETAQVVIGLIGRAHAAGRAGRP